PPCSVTPTTWQRSSRLTRRRQPSSTPWPAPLPDEAQTANGPTTPIPHAGLRSPTMRERVCSHPKSYPPSVNYLKDTPLADLLFKVAAHRLHSHVHRSLSFDQV